MIQGMFLPQMLQTRSGIWTTPRVHTWLVMKLKYSILAHERALDKSGIRTSFKDFGIAPLVQRGGYLSRSNCLSRQFHFSDCRLHEGALFLNFDGFCRGNEPVSRFLTGTYQVSRTSSADSDEGCCTGSLPLKTCLVCQRSPFTRQRASRHSCTPVVRRRQKRSRYVPLHLGAFSQLS